MIQDPTTGLFVPEKGDESVKFKYVTAPNSNMDAYAIAEDGTLYLLDGIEFIPCRPAPAEGA